MKTRRKPRFYVPALIAVTVVTAVHSVAALAADAGTPRPGPTATAPSGTADAGDDADADAGARASSGGCGQEQAGLSSMTLFGVGCC
ncbi:MAG TPA: hypothetical protein PLR99_02505 [Polyangiaceae bacterium]|jgi:hypothetical protein|nr:hypothetical protein [Polyangiaceae bacterium]